jgi:hypothetical protein
MAALGQISIGENIIESTKKEIRSLKLILDKLEVPYILDDISFHNTLMDLYRLKRQHGTEVWKVEKDGSVSLKNRFGHSGRFECNYLRMPSLVEFQFADLNLLTESETEFLSYIIFDAETKPAITANASESS